MFRCLQILVSTVVLGASAVSLSACGQQGPLYLPTEPAATNRATLPETLFPSGARNIAPPHVPMPSPSAKPPANAASAATLPAQ